MTREEAEKLMVGQKIRIVREAKVVEVIGPDNCLKVNNGHDDFYVYYSIVEHAEGEDKP